MKIEQEKLESLQNLVKIRFIAKILKCICGAGIFVSILFMVYIAGHSDSVSLWGFVEETWSYKKYLLYGSLDVASLYATHKLFEICEFFERSADDRIQDLVFPYTLH